jgi:D-alanyl-D-alanine carboxypeptidase
MRDSAFAKIAGTASTDIPLTDGRHLSSQNTNLLLGSYEGCIGVKTGFTRKAGYCLSSAATRNGVTLFLVLLNSRSQSSRFTESAALLDYGFRIMAQEATKKTSD